jgi:hypothetical protein
MDYNVSIIDRKITLVSQTEDAVGGNKGDTIRFTFDDEWQGQEIKAAFFYNGIYKIRKVENNICEVPPIYQSVSFRLGVFVGDDESATPYLSTTTIEVSCRLSTRDYLLGHKMDDEEFYIEALKVLNEIRDIAENAAEDAREEVTRLVGEIGIVQTTGDSPTAVMSQKATTALYNRNDKRITNLEQGLPDDNFVTDSAIGYEKDVPSNALPYAEIKKVGGMTYKDGDTLKSAKVTEIKSEGANLADVSAFTNTTISNGIVTQVTPDTANLIYFKLAQWTRDYDLLFEEPLYETDLGEIKATLQLVKGTSWIVFGIKGSTIDTTVKINVEDLPRGLYTLSWQYTNNTQGSISWRDIQLNKGETALPYSPYLHNTLPIPEEVQALDGYGAGISTEYYNYINRENEVFVKRIGEVNLGTLNWVKMGSYNVWEANITNLNILQPSGTYDVFHCLHSLYVGSSVSTAIWNATENTITSTDKKLFCCNNQETMPTGVLLYVMNTPEFIDISDILLADNFIEVEGGGTITAVNEHGLAVPSEIEYQLEV